MSRFFTQQHRSLHSLRSPLSKHRRLIHAFTMTELVMVILILGIIGAVILPRVFDRSGYEARSFTDQSMFMLRYAQKVAIAQNRPVYVRLNGSSVALCFAAYPADGSCAAANQVAAPNINNSGTANTLAACAGVTTWYCEGFASGISYTTAPALPAASSYFYYDALGAPFTYSDVSPTPTSSFTLLLIRITGDGINHDIYVEPESGYVHS